MQKEQDKKNYKHKHYGKTHVKELVPDICL